MNLKSSFVSVSKRAAMSTMLAGCAAMVMFCAGCGRREQDNRFAVFEKGSYLADIVVPENMGGVEKYAVEELAYHFKKAFGKAPEIVSEAAHASSPYPYHIYIGATKAAIAAAMNSSL